jgi:RNA polymerase sigma-70 factor (ECF subfamily)
MPSFTQSTDAELRQACLKGDRRAQQALYQKYYGKLLGIPMRYTGNQAEAKDLLNQAFLQIFRSLPDYTDTGSFAGWMSTITFRVTMDHLRMEQRYRERYSLEVPDRSAIDSRIEGQLEAADIFRCIQQLPDYLRVVFSLYVIDGYKHQEISAMIGITEDTSKWRLRKARQLLQAALEQDYLNNDQSA